MTCLASSLFLAFSSGAALAAEAATTSTAAPSKNEAELANVAVVGNWLDDANTLTVLNHPGARTIVNRQAIVESAATNVRDVLRTVPGVQVQDSNGTGGSDLSLNVGVRGLTARLSPRSTVLMDGVPLAFAPYGQPQLSLAPVGIGNLDRVDVVRGGGSVRFGPQNVGGIINFVTRAIPKEFSRDVNIETQGAEHGGLKTTTSAFIGGTDQDIGFGSALLYSGVKGDGYRDSNDHVNIDDVLLKTRYKLSAQDELTANLHYYDATADMPGGLTPKEFAANPFQSVPDDDSFSGRRQDVSLKYSHKDGTRSFEVLTYYTDTVRNSVIANKTDSISGVRKFTSLSAYPRNYNTFAIEPRYSQLFLWGEASHEISVGYRYLKESMRERSSTAAVDPVSGDPTGPFVPGKDNTGNTVANSYYVDDTIEFGNWRIVPGIRFEDISTHWSDSVNNINREKSYNQPLPSLNTSYSLSDAWKLFANYNTSFGSIQYFQLGQGGKGDAADPNLGAEKAHTYEAGTRFNNGQWSGELTVFNIDFDQELLFVKTDGWTNLGATRHQGVETAFSYNLDTLSPALKGLSAYATFTYTKAQSVKGDAAGTDLPFYSRRVGTIGTRYERGPWLFNADAFFQSNQNSPPPTPAALNDGSGRYGNIPGYGLFNVRGEYKFGKNMQNLRLAAGVKNVFNHEYFTRSTDNNSGMYVGMPRTFFVQAGLGF